MIGENIYRAEIGQDARNAAPDWPQERLGDVEKKLAGDRDACLRGLTTPKA